ncbi:hypothetical protein [Hymenobacter metallicola]|uniref:Uncharacterized protein n=1 Tax=Hymenobacter metallicola TaxID=2563114 RepID=A0A4Z0QM42_9BACT|nr:hypothetical protein [Hymenobacter metallicola]TGE29812.1 hypothetical protein E5K02_10235 [Hymenobacter metallicola]
MADEALTTEDEATRGLDAPGAGDTAPVVPAPALPYAFLGRPDAARDLILADQLHHWLVGGPPTADSPYTTRELRLWVQQARLWLDAEITRKNKEIEQADFVTRQKLERESFFDDVRAKSEFGETPERWMQTFILQVLTDPDTEEQYSELPEAFVNLRRYQNLPGEEGVYAVMAVKEVDRRHTEGTLVKLTPGQELLIDQTLPFGLFGRYGFRREGARIKYSRDRGMKPIAAAKLLAKLILRDSRLTTLPEAPLIAAAHDFEILKLAQQFALKRKAEDKLNDNNSTTIP